MGRSTSLVIVGILCLVGCTDQTSTGEVSPREPGQALSMRAAALGTASVDRDLGCCPVGFELHSCRTPGGHKGWACHNPEQGCESTSVCGAGCDPRVTGRCRCVQNVLCVRGDHFDRNLCQCVPDQPSGGDGSGGAICAGSGGSGSGGAIGSGGSAGGNTGSAGGLGTAGVSGAGGAAGGSAGSLGTGGTFVCPVGNDPLSTFVPDLQVGAGSTLAIRAYSPTFIGTTLPATFHWSFASSNGGALTFSSTDSSWTSFTCTAIGSGEVIVTIGYLDTDCASTWKWAFNCLP